MTRVQYGALPYRRGKSIELLLITSRKAGRWIIPKGWPIDGSSPSTPPPERPMRKRGSAASSAKRRSACTSTGSGRRRGRRVSCRVKVFPLRVKRQRRKWPERHQRKTKWVSLREAVSLVAEKELRALISNSGITSADSRPDPTLRPAFSATQPR